MTRRALAFLLCFAFAPTAGGDEMTYEQAKQRLKPTPLPEFWIGDVAGLPARWEKLRAGTCEVIATSPGGRPLHLIVYGERENVRHRANFNSAIGGQDPSAYLDKDARKKPVIFFVGPVHGHEVEALTGLVNLIHVMDEFQFWGQGTWHDHKIAYWPDSKRQHPRTGPEIGFLGCYFNDAGINPMHDEFFAPMSAEAPAILKVAMHEGPDLAVSLHSHEAAPALLRPAYVPLEEQQRVIGLAERSYALLAARGLPHGKPFMAPGRKRSPAGFVQPGQRAVSRQRRDEFHVRVPARNRRSQGVPGQPGADPGHPTDAVRSDDAVCPRSQGQLSRTARSRRTSWPPCWSSVWIARHG